MKPHRGDRVTTRHGASAAYGSHATGWAHEIKAASEPATITKVTRWHVEITYDDGGVALVPRSSLEDAS
jgi:hypothetical protein